MTPNTLLLPQKLFWMKLPQTAFGIILQTVLTYPMEDIWSYLDGEIKKRRIRSIAGLQRALTKAWSELPWRYVRKSTESMAARLREVIALGGERTQY